MLQVPQTGGIVLVDERKPDLSYRLLGDRANGKRRILCLTREPPERVASRHPMKNVRHYWLITSPGPQTVNPFHLDAVRAIIERFIRRSKESVVLIDGIELLMVMNTYEGVREFLTGLHALLREHRAECVIPIDSRTLTSTEFGELKAMFPMMRGAG